MHLLKLCETREYSPQLLEHWLHTIQKLRRPVTFELREENKKIALLCSEDISSHLPGSRCVPASQASPSETTTTQYFLHQPKGPLLPIKRYSQFEDRTQKTHIAPLDQLLPLMAKTPGARITFEWTTISERRRERALKKAKKLHFEPERRFDQWESRGWFRITLRRFLGPLIRRTLLHPSTQKEAQEQTESLHEREDPRRAVLDKLSRPLFKVTITLTHPFKEFWNGFTLPYLGELHVRKKPGTLILSAEELATLLSPPTAKTHAAELHTEATAYLPPPTGNPLLIDEEDRKRHLYLVGKTGMGKSTALLHLFAEDARQNRAIVLLDPHGDLITDALKILPPEKHKDVILLDPSVAEFPLALNPLECRAGENANLKTSALVEMFEALSKGSWGPRLEYILRNALLLLIHAPNTTLLDLPRLLTNEKTCRELLRHTDNLELHRFFEEEFLMLDSKTRQEHIAPILNKVGPLLTTPLLRNIFGQPRSKFSFETAFAEKKIVLISLSKGKLGEDASRLLGMIFISMIQSTLLKRADRTLENRETVCITLDEFQNFSTKTLLGMLSESRKYGLALTLAHQYLTQVAEEIQDAVLGNVGSLLCFRTSFQDAEILAPSLGLVEEDLTALAPFQAYAKLLRHQAPLPLFRLDLPKPALQNDAPLDQLQKCSLQRYGRRVSLVEEKIKNRYNKHMRKFLAVLALIFCLNSAPLTLASNYDSFPVFEVLEVTDTTSDNVDNSTDLRENLEEEANTKNTSIAGAIILRAINILTLLIGTFAFVMIMYGGFMMVTAGGEESQVEKAKGILTQSIFGVVLAFLAYFIVAFVQSFFY